MHALSWTLLSTLKPRSQMRRSSSFSRGNFAHPRTTCRAAVARRDRLVRRVARFLARTREGRFFLLLRRAGRRRDRFGWRREGRRVLIRGERFLRRRAGLRRTRVRRRAIFRRDFRRRRDARGRLRRLRRRDFGRRRRRTFFFFRLLVPMIAHVLAVGSSISGQHPIGRGNGGQIACAGLPAAWVGFVRRTVGSSPRSGEGRI